jgi:phosphoglycerate dehydrogenase-like enzyme
MNIGIIGYGKIGKVRHAVLDKMGEHHVVHICDPVHPRVILTPHVGSYTQEGRLMMEMEAAQNILDGLGVD